MARPSQPPDLAALGFGDELDDVLRGANPNPTREGCLPREVLVALSRRDRSIDDPAWEHLLECSPCYCEVRDMQLAHLVALHERPTRRWWIGAAAAAALVVALGVWWLAASRGAVPGVTEPPTTIPLTLDLRPYSVTRSSTASDAFPPLELPRGLVELTLLLPVGSMPGSYDVQVVDAAQRSLASTQGDAALRDFVTTLEATLNLSDVAPGNYRLAVRTTGDGWRDYPAIVSRP
jgi:hypothetical protein